MKKPTAQKYAINSITSPSSFIFPKYQSQPYIKQARIKVKQNFRILFKQNNHLLIFHVYFLMNLIISEFKKRFKLLGKYFSNFHISIYPQSPLSKGDTTCTPMATPFVKSSDFLRISCIFNVILRVETTRANLLEPYRVFLFIIRNYGGSSVSNPLTLLVECNTPILLKLKLLGGK